MLSLFDDEIFVHARMLSLGVWFFLQIGEYSVPLILKLLLFRYGTLVGYVQQLFFYL